MFCIGQFLATNNVLIFVENTVYVGIIIPNLLIIFKSDYWLLMQGYLNQLSTEGPLLTLQPFKKEICCSASFTDNSKIFELNAIQKNLLNAAMKKKSVQ